MKKLKALFSILSISILIVIACAITKATPLDEQFSVVAAVAPSYPQALRTARLKGDVIVEVKIDQSGSVISAEAVSGHRALIELCIKAAKAWQFSPENKSGISRKTRLTFSFRDMERDEKEDELIIRFLPPYKVEVIWNPPPISHLKYR